MFFVLVEISNYRQLSQLRNSEAVEIKGLLEHFSQNRGGRLTREQNGFFLFSFHPLREKVLEQVSEFLFLTSETLQKKREDLFGFSLLLEQEDQGDEGAVFHRLKAMIFLAPRENRVWAGPKALPSLLRLFPVSADDPLSEILGPPQKTTLPPLSVDRLLEMTGWVEALKVPLGRQLSEGTEGRTGKILRLKGAYGTEKFFVLKTVLHQLYGEHEDFPVLFPLEESRDFLSQLLARVDVDQVRTGPMASDPAWTALLETRGGGDYPGDSGRQDVVGALDHHFRTLIKTLIDRGLPPVFVFLLPHSYEPEAQEVLDSILGDLVAKEGLKLLLLESPDREPSFLVRHASLSWNFPPLTWDRIVHERDVRGWQDRFPLLHGEILDHCAGRGMSWVHYLWSLQEGTDPSQVEPLDPSWSLFQGLDPSYHKVYFVLWAGRGLLEERQLVDFFTRWGEDAAVIQDRVRSLGAMGFFLGGVPWTLRPDLGSWLSHRLGEEGKELQRALGDFLFEQWSRDHALSEILFSHLAQWGRAGPSTVVLRHYLTNKINQGRGDFLSLLRPRLWHSAATEETADHLKIISAGAKLRYSLNLGPLPWPAPELSRFRRYFGPRTETPEDGEWQLQQGRYHLRSGDLALGFPLLKRALLQAQETDDRPLEVRAETEIGLALIRRNRLEEGREYFEIASKLAEKTGSSYLVTLTSGLDAVALFLLGHLTNAQLAIERGLMAGRQGGLRRWSVFLLFLRARLEFDQGDYSAALGTLEETGALCHRYHFADISLVIRAWRGRVEAYSGNGPGARSWLEPLPSSSEKGYFLAEAAYLEQDWSRALDCILQAQAFLRPTQPFGRGEVVDWSSGFAGIEDRALARPGDRGVLENQIEGFRWLLEGLTRDPSTAIQSFQTLLGRRALIDLDPSAASFYYWFYLIVPKNDVKQEAQRLTLLGRGLKAIQVRSSRIEDPGQRHEYLVKPYWNTQLALEARKLKLL